MKDTEIDKYWLLTYEMLDEKDLDGEWERKE